MLEAKDREVRDICHVGPLLPTRFYLSSSARVYEVFATAQHYEIVPYEIRILAISHVIPEKKIRGFLTKHAWVRRISCTVQDFVRMPSR